MSSDHVVIYKSAEVKHKMKLDVSKLVLKLSHFMSSSSSSGPQVPTVTPSHAGPVTFESSVSKPLRSSKLPQGLSARQQLLPICPQTTPTQVVGRLGTSGPNDHKRPDESLKPEDFRSP